MRRRANHKSDSFRFGSKIDLDQIQETSMLQEPSQVSARRPDDETCKPPTCAPQVGLPQKIDIAPADLLHAASVLGQL
jgi:hypothetical protein